MALGLAYAGRQGPLEHYRRQILSMPFTPTSPETVCTSGERDAVEPSDLSKCRRFATFFSSFIAVFSPPRKLLLQQVVYNCSL